MYRQWAERRHMLFEQLMPDGDADGPAILHVVGFGAFRTLSEEAGLHLMEEADNQSGRRLVARVRVAAGPDEDPRPDQAYRTYVDVIDRAEELTAVVRRYRENPAPLVRDAKAGWRSGKLDMVLAGDFDLMGTLP
jgi:ATP-dependent Clp protease ATP-binding subunit ClpC